MTTNRNESLAGLHRVRSAIVVSASANDLGDVVTVFTDEHAVGTLGPADGVGRYRQTDRLQGAGGEANTTNPTYGTRCSVGPCGP